MLFSVRRWRIKRKVSQCIRALAVWQTCYFVGDMKYKDAEKIHDKRMAVFYALHQNRQIFTPPHDVLLSSIERLASIIASLNQLYFRVKDKSIFEICSHELHLIQKASIAFLMQISNNSNSLVFYELNEAIHSFEKLFEETLRVVVPDPTVFLFFIQDLFSLKNTMNIISREQTIAY
jgi:hypothetical protein